MHCNLIVIKRRVRLEKIYVNQQLSYRIVELFDVVSQTLDAASSKKATNTIALVKNVCGKTCLPFGSFFSIFSRCKWIAKFNEMLEINFNSFNRTWLWRIPLFEFSVSRWWVNSRKIPTESLRSIHIRRRSTSRLKDEKCISLEAVVGAIKRSFFLFDGKSLELDIE